MQVYSGRTDVWGKDNSPQTNTIVGLQQTPDKNRFLLFAQLMDEACAKDAPQKIQFTSHEGVVPLVFLMPHNRTGVFPVKETDFKSRATVLDEDLNQVLSVPYEFVLGADRKFVPVRHCFTKEPGLYIAETGVIDQGLPEPIGIIGMAAALLGASEDDDSLDEYRTLVSLEKGVTILDKAPSRLVFQDWRWRPYTSPTWSPDRKYSLKVEDRRILITDELAAGYTTLLDPFSSKPSAYTLPLENVVSAFWR